MGWVKYIGETKKSIAGMEWEPGEVRQLADYKVRQLLQRAPDVLKPAEPGESPKQASRAKPKRKAAQVDEDVTEGEE